MQPINTLTDTAQQNLEQEWQAEFSRMAHKRLYLLGLLAAAIYPASLLDLVSVPEAEKAGFLVVRLLPTAVIMLTLLAHKFLKLHNQFAYIVIGASIIAASAYRGDIADFVNFVIINAVVYGVFGTLAYLKFRYAILTATIAVAINIIMYFGLYRNSIPLNQSGLAIIAALATMMVLLLRFRYENMRKNFMTNQLLQLQNKKIESHRNDLLLINEEVSQQKEEIQSQRDAILQKSDELGHALSMIESKNKSITASINYARRIQHAILPKADLLNKVFKEHFIFFKPKDIVSGDLYWMRMVEGKAIVAAIDCTGHGVPGAFMSLIADSILRQVVEAEHLTDPAEILQQMHQKIKVMLHSTEPTDTHKRIRDGMDVSMCCIDKANNNFRYAGAKNPLVYVQNNTFHYIRGSKHAIGEQANREVKFESTEFTLQPDTTIYLFSDGYQDQFGGPEGRKFMATRFRSLLKNNAHLPLNEQQQVLEATFEQWLNNEHKQIDDVLVIGGRL